VHALVRGIESLLPRPFARGRALKGDQAPDPTGTLSPIRASLLVEGCVSRPPLRPGPNPRGHGRGHSGLFPYGGVCVATAPMRRWAKSRSNYVRGPGARSPLTRGALCGTTYKWRGTSREHDARTVCGITKYVRRKGCLITSGPRTGRCKGEYWSIERVAS